MVYIMLQSYRVIDSTVVAVLFLDFDLKLVLLIVDHFIQQFTSYRLVNEYCKSNRDIEKCKFIQHIAC